jgi:hypothetical protein
MSGIGLIIGCDGHDEWIDVQTTVTVKMLQIEIQSLCNFYFLKIVKIEPANKIQSFFSKRNAFSARKTSLFIYFTSLIGME